MNPTPSPQENWEKRYKAELEEVLDEYFPKIEEEGPAKVANKRAEALMLFAKALILTRQVELEARRKERERIRTLIPAKLTHGACDDQTCEACGWNACRDAFMRILRSPGTLSLDDLNQCAKAVFP